MERPTLMRPTCRSMRLTPEGWRCNALRKRAETRTQWITKNARLPGRSVVMQAKASSPIHRALARSLRACVIEIE